MYKFLVLISTALMTIITVSTAIAQEKPAGTSPFEGIWLTKNGESHVKVEQCDKTLCNQIVWLQTPNDPSGKPMADILNKNSKLRGRPIIGISIMLNMRQVSKTEWRGSLYEPRKGKSYPGKAQLIGKDKLKLTGCHPVLPICQSQFWKKISELKDYKLN